jgi:peptidoglycan/xylan/chitin deacetylase (PgdA/CDA1 family)
MGAGAVGLAEAQLGRTKKVKKTHIVTLSFDDGFKKSFFKTAEIYESFKLRACFNVIAQGHLENFRPSINGVPDAGIVPFPKGDFSDWNALKKRGHEVMAHTYDHKNLTTIPLSDAKKDIDRCVEEFEKNLRGFLARDSVHNFAYNASNAELDAYALSKFLVVRSQGDTVINPIPTVRKPVRIGCWSHGPENCDEFFEETLNEFLASPGGWFVFNTHGLDDEGWGPMSSRYLQNLLARLVKLDHVEVLPAGAVVQRLPKPAR